MRVSSLVEVKKRVPSGTIILNRPDKRNALSRPMITRIKEAFEDLRLERSVRAVILTGAGDAFCAGLDLAEIQQTNTQDQENAYAQSRSDTVAYKQLIEAMLRHPKPIIAAVNGPAVAAGAALVLASDIVVAAADATFGLPEPRRGLVAGLVSPLLAFRAGGGTAANLLLSARTVEADEAHRLGLYHELHKANLIWARAHEIAGQCAESAPESLQLTKQMLNETIGERLNVLLSAGAAASAAARTTEAAAEGVSAFLEKRQPNWP